ncbi:hypothetical protein [Butyrivibrio hungatei]|uniref:Uncharacterized protein n=1 Tax=Butyrivibrio hungatei TaxID=185008 RepID=A0A1D9P5P6_9FIRM|nr:hypothetical protein [Butyrivibrio hungatei]AOZ97897.1 hypothetical protein bhn_II098 [Butyrivibrio hungatei]
MQKVQYIKLPGETVTTTFWQDFSIADKFGINAIKDTYENAFNSWKHDYRYITNLAIVMNYKAFDYSELNEDIAEVYVDLYHKTNSFALNNFKGDELKYYLEITD